MSDDQEGEEGDEDSDDASSNENDQIGKEPVKPSLDPEDELRAFKDADPQSKEWKNR